jgi:hypothetical protein
LCLSAFCHGDKLSDQLKRKKDLFWPIVSEVSVCGLVDSVALGLVVRQNIKAKNTSWSKAAYLLVPRKQREKEMGQGPNIPFKAVCC